MISFNRKFKSRKEALMLTVVFALIAHAAFSLRSVYDQYKTVVVFQPISVSSHDDLVSGLPEPMLRSLTLMAFESGFAVTLSIVVSVWYICRIWTRWNRGRDST